MSTAPSPWDNHPALTEDRLVTVAQILRRVRDEALELHEPLKGEGNWSLGSRVYERTMHALEEAAVDAAWLKTIKAGLYFVFMIDDVPVRFYRGDAEEPSPRAMKTHSIGETERKAAQMCLFAIDEANRQWFWRMCVEVDERGRALRVVMLQATENGDTRNQWVIPTLDGVAVVAPIAPPREGVELPPPMVASKPAPDAVENDDTKKAANDD